MLELEHGVGRHAQRVHDHVVAVQLDEVEAAEHGRVLILAAAANAQLLAFDRVRHLGQLVVGHGDAGELLQHPDQHDHHRRGGSEPGARRRVRMQQQVEAAGVASRKAADRRLRQVELAIEDGHLLRRDLDRNTIIQTLTDEDKRGRVMSYYTMAFMGMATFGSRWRERLPIRFRRHRYGSSGKFRWPVRNGR